MINPFYAFCSQLEHIDRFNKSKCIHVELVSSHSLQVAMFAHALCLLENKISGASYDANYAAVCGMYQDISEVITEDINSKFKNISPSMAKLNKELESHALSFLFNMTPEPISGELKNIIFQKDAHSIDFRKLLKAADLLSALAKATQELRCGNLDFKKPVEDITSALNERSKEFPSIEYFMKKIIPSFSHSVDELLDMIDK